MRGREDVSSRACLRLLAATLALLAVALGAWSCDGDTGPAPQGMSRMALLGGEPDSAHPMVAAFTRTKLCSAVLVDAQTLLTSGTCVDFQASKQGPISPIQPAIFDAHHRIAVAGHTVHPEFFRGITQGPVQDLAFLRLEHASPLEPARLSIHRPRVGMPVTLIGYGASGTRPDDSGVRRASSNVIDAIDDDSGRFRIARGSGDGPLFRLGDAGGPVFARVNGREVLVGVVSATDGRHTWCTSLSAHAAWLGEVLSPDSIPAPEITIVSPRDGARVSAEVVISIEILSADSVQQVTCSVADRVLQVLLEPPYTCQLQLDPGPQRVDVHVELKRGTAVADIALDLSVMGSLDAATEGDDATDGGSGSADAAIDTQSQPSGQDARGAETQSNTEQSNTEQTNTEQGNTSSGGCTLSRRPPAMPVWAWLLLAWFLCSSRRRDRVRIE